MRRNFPHALALVTPQILRLNAQSLTLRTTDFYYRDATKGIRGRNPCVLRDAQPAAYTPIWFDWADERTSHDGVMIQPHAAGLPTTPGGHVS